MEYIAPSYKNVRFTCPHCNTLSLHKWERHSFTEDLGGTGVAIDFSQCLDISRCFSCGQYTIWINRVGDTNLVYPAISPPEPNKDMPQSVLDLYLEAGRIFTMSPRAACALLRLSIDRLCSELGANDRDINKNIGSLVQKGLPSKIQKALDVVRVVGNKAVHPGQIAFDVDDEKTAIMLFELINLITNHMISEPNKLNVLFDSLPERTREAVALRDTPKS